MKKITTLVSAIALAIGMACPAMAGEPISASQVPEGLNTFIKTHFGDNVTIVRAERERKGQSYEYEVRLSNGFEVDYRAAQEWLEVEGPNVPTSIVGEEIMKHITVNYPGKSVKKISREYNTYEVELNDGTDLIYDTAGHFVRVDY